MKELKVVVVSDAHRYEKGFFQVLEQEPDADAYWDLGDNFCGGEPSFEFKNRWISVQGNNDLPYFTDKIDLDIFGKKVRLMHGDQLFWYYYTVQDFYGYMEKEGIDILLFGHTHQRLADVETDEKGRVVKAMINPGSIGRSREMELVMQNKGSYCVLHFYEDGRMEYTFKTISILHD